MRRMQKGGLTRGDVISANKIVKEKAFKKLRIPLIKVKEEEKPIKKTRSQKIHSNNSGKRKYVIRNYNNVYHGEIHECSYCSCEIHREDSEYYTIDHIVPLELGGSNDICNIVPACRNCNFEKGRLTIDEWLNILTRKYDKTEGLNTELLYKIMRVMVMKRYVDRMGDKLYI